MKKTSTLLLTSLLLAFSGSVSAATVVTVNGVKIDSSDIERRARNVQANSQGQVVDGPPLRQYLTNALVVEQLVSQEAKRLKLDQSSQYKAAEAEALQQIKTQGLDKVPTFKQDWADFQSNLLMETYAEHILKQNPVTDAQIQQKYQSIKSRYHQQNEVQLGGILSNKAADIDAALKDLKNKKKFADVAKKYSMDENTKHNGGLQNYTAMVDLKENNPMIYQAIANLNKGQFTQTPLKEGEAQLILYVNDIRKINVPTFEQLKGQIKGDLESEQIDLAVNQLGQKAKIVPAK